MRGGEGGLAQESAGAELWELRVPLGKARGLSGSRVCGDGNGTNTCNATFPVYL